MHCDANLYTVFISVYLGRAQRTPMWSKKLSSLTQTQTETVCAADTDTDRDRHRLCLSLSVSVESVSVSVSVSVCVSRCLAVPVTREGENHSVPHYVAKRGNKCILTSRKMASKSPSAESKSE